MTQPLTPTDIATELGRAGVCVCPAFLEASLVGRLRADLIELQHQGKFHRAGIGHAAELGVHDEVRRDDIYWLDHETVSTEQKELWEKFDSLKQALNRTLFLGVNYFEAHYASYPAGGFYHRHLDSFAKNNSRFVSVVVYLNENWQPSDGGQLRIYSETSQIDVEPVGGTMVCFMSGESEHEVLLSSAPRLSIAGWFTRPI